MAQYLLLTGATGLLGHYLIRDLLRAGIKLALIVRRSRVASARERVDRILQQWEKRYGYALPRPVVFEGDLTAANLNLSATDVNWISAHCSALLNSAASLTFHSDSSIQEPWATNVRGTENLLEFCRYTGIRQFHQVSTAYVCGLRSDRVLESELDVGQERGNDYELSKAEGERLVRSAGFLESVTVYRPGIIIGDSRSGFTTTFHGFYVPLKVISVLMGQGCLFGLTSEELQSSETLQFGASQLVELLGLTGREKKHLVPVDWVSSIIAGVVPRTELHGTTFHLTPSQPVTVATMQEVMLKAFSQNMRAGTSRRFAQSDHWSIFQEQYVEQMSVYRSYWRDDPEFDTANVSNAFPDLPCPTVDAGMLDRTCQFAIKSNFREPAPRRIGADEDIDQMLHARLVDASSASGGQPDQFISLTVNGVGGGEWELGLHHTRPVVLQRGISRRCTARVYMNSWTFRKLQKQDLTVMQGISSGRMLIEGQPPAADQIAAILQSVITDDRSNSLTVRCQLD